MNDTLIDLHEKAFTNLSLMAILYVVFSIKPIAIDSNFLQSREYITLEVIT